MRQRPGAGRPPTIVLADDDVDAVEVLSKLLIAAGYRCLPTPGGAAAYRVFLQAQPDLLVTDLNMPSGDGYTLIDRAREEMNVPVLAITGKRTPAWDRLTEEHDGVHLLMKPFGRREFLDVVGRLLEKNRSEDDVSSASVVR